MENNNLNISLQLAGLSASSFNDVNACFQLLLNKSLENEKQCNDIKLEGFSETNNSLLKTLNAIDTNIKNDPSSINTETYTLDDLLNLGNEEVNPTSLFDGSFDEESLFAPQNEIAMETIMASPLSSSSEESCDLDDILFMNEFSQAPVSPEVTTTSQEPTLFTSDDHESLFKANSGCQQPSLEDLLNLSGVDLGLLLNQTQGTEAPECQSTLDLSEILTVPASPASSVTSTESESESTSSVRYKPYKKQKTPEQKQRKKAQNRTAATRYRIKKKDELKTMSEEADKLEEKNKELKGKVDGLRNEIDYLKNLMLDVIKARLAKGTQPDNILSAILTN